MNTIRTMAIATGILVLAGCGSNAVPTPAKADRPAVTVTTQPLGSWLSSVSDVSGKLSSDLNDLSTDPSDDSAAERLAADATAGLNLKPPAAHAGLDLAWRRVMNDYLVAKGDLDGGDFSRATTDLEQATSDTTVLQGDINTL